MPTPIPPQMPLDAKGREQRPGRIGFNGELHESAIARYLLGIGYRAYSPLLMCFNKPDNMSPFGAGGLDAYAYCLGDPVNSQDPSGHSSWFTRFLSRRFNPSATLSYGPLPPGLPKAWPLNPAPGVPAGKNYGGVLVDRVLRTLNPATLTKLRSLSQDVKRRIDDYSERNFKVFAQGRRSQDWLPYRVEGGRDVTYVEKVILAARGRVPGVSYAQAYKTMKLSEAKRQIAVQNDVNVVLPVGIDNRYEDFPSRTELAARARASIAREFIRRAG